MQKMSRALGGASSGVLRWLDAGRGSIVAALAIALAVPSVNTVTFDGLPFDSLWEVAAFAALLPFVFSGTLREALAGVLVRRAPWGRRAVLVAAATLIVLKVLLLGIGSDRGFVACFSSTWMPSEQRCEDSYANVFHRHDGATRIDDEIDFGPTENRASRLVTAYSTLVYKNGTASTNWNLSFANDLRFNAAQAGDVSLHELMPFEASWHGDAEIPDDGVVEITYVGRGTLSIGDTAIALPATDVSRTIHADAPAGTQRLEAEFGFPVGATAAELRLLSQDGGPIEAAGPSPPQQVVSFLVWLALVAASILLGLIALAALRGDLWSLGLVAAAAVAISLLSTAGEQVGFQYLAAATVLLVVWRTPKRPVLWAYGALLVVEGASVLNGVGEVGAVLYRAAGTDFLTYESFAREVVLEGSIGGGEDVFYYQPGSRYVLGVMHLLFGDGDVLVTWWSMLALSLSFASLAAWHRRRVSSSLGLLAISAAAFLMLVLLNSPTILSLVAMGASEVPTWALLPLAVAAPQLQPLRNGAWLGSAAAAALIWVMRNNQAFGVATIMAAIFAGLWRRRRGLLVAVAATALVVGLLPAIHNMAYGQDLVLSTTSNPLAQEIEISDLSQVFSGSDVGSEIQGHVSALFYDPPTPELATASLRWVFWGLLAIWVAAIVLALARLKQQRLSPGGWLLLFLPVAYLAPHVVYQVEVYYPRHIVAGYLAMGVGALGVFAELLAQGRAWQMGALAARARAAVPGLPARPTVRARDRIGEFRWTRLALTAVAFLAPFSATNLPGPLTLGRAAALAFATVLGLDLLASRRPRIRPSKPALMLGLAYLGFAAWVFLNSAALGCNCNGKTSGLGEFAMVGLLALVAIGCEPRLRRPVLLATLAGVVFASLLAMLGVGSLNSGTIDLTQTGGRLSGTFGNANELGFAAALGIPIAIAFLTVGDRLKQAVAAVSILVLALTILLTYSRGAIIAAAVGALAVLVWQARGSRRRIAATLLAGGACVLAGAALYSVFEEERQEASFEAVSPALRPLDVRDLTGWDSRAGGPISRGPSRLFNRASVLAVRTEAGEGASFRWGEAEPGGSYTLRFRARSLDGRLPFVYALASGTRPEAGGRASGILNREWRQFSLRWRPQAVSPQATFYVWRGARQPGLATIALDDIAVAVRSPEDIRTVIALPTRLEGSLYDRLTSKADRAEDRYLRSRLDAADLALEAFLSEPLIGIGWGTFPEYAQEHLDYGLLAAHDQYLAVAAELGVLGVLLLGLFFAAVIVGVRRLGPSAGRPEAAAIGVLAAGAAGLVFVEALPVPQLAIALAIAAAVVCAQPRRAG